MISKKSKLSVDKVEHDSNYENTLRSNKSDIVNPKDTKLQVVFNGNFNIKDNMKASYGIMFKEGKIHLDQGPSYLDSLSVKSGENNGLSRTKLTL